MEKKISKETADMAENIGYVFTYTEKDDILSRNLVSLSNIQRWLSKEKSITVTVLDNNGTFVPQVNDNRTTAVYDAYDDALEDGLQTALKL